MSHPRSRTARVHRHTQKGAKPGTARVPDQRFEPAVWGGEFHASAETSASTDQRVVVNGDTVRAVPKRFATFSNATTTSQHLVVGSSSPIKRAGQRLDDAGRDLKPRNSTSQS